LTTGGPEIETLVIVTFGAKAAQAAVLAPLGVAELLPTLVEIKFCPLVPLVPFVPFVPLAPAGPAEPVLPPQPARTAANRVAATNMLGRDPGEKLPTESGFFMKALLIRLNGRTS
jgi:hypothetical protein